MPNPAWISALEGQLKENPKSVSEYLGLQFVPPLRLGYALSTLTPDGKPKVRYVIHRASRSDQSLVYTDSKSLLRLTSSSRPPTRGCKSPTTLLRIKT